MILIGVRTDNVAEEPQTPKHDRLGDWRMNRSQADFLVGDMGSECNGAEETAEHLILQCPSHVQICHEMWPNL